MGLIPYRAQEKQPSMSLLQDQLSGPLRSKLITSPIFMPFLILISEKEAENGKNPDLTV